MPDGARIGLPSAALCGSTAVSAEPFRGAFAQFAPTVFVIATDGAAGRAGVTCASASAVARPDGTPLIYQRRAYAKTRMLA